MCCGGCAHHTHTRAAQLSLATLGSGSWLAPSVLQGWCPEGSTQRRGRARRLRIGAAQLGSANILCACRLAVATSRVQRPGGSMRHGGCAHHMHTRAAQLSLATLGSGSWLAPSFPPDY